MEKEVVFKKKLTVKSIIIFIVIFRIMFDVDIYNRIIVVESWF